ncbi:MAG: topoisomerase DNA-binding C4 zinc finger domain-containing protein, partial [Clostridia bacterium]|nr:topoisomerase DNA-binding C4 zinc finger domain-containing protein [Clostridia bacterium]
SGKFGKFLACPNYPECSSILPIDAKATEEKCTECGANMLLKHGKYGKYLECPTCAAKRPFVSESGEDAEKLEGKCPECGKPMRRMHSKSGKIYYGCTGYPDCKFLSWDIATGDKCPVCGKYLIKRGAKIKCSDKECNCSVDVPEENG